MPHIDERIDFCVDVMIVHDAKVLLHQHDKYKEWYFVGGHIEPGEDAEEAALREVNSRAAIPRLKSGARRIRARILAHGNRFLCVSRSASPRESGAFRGSGSCAPENLARAARS